MVDLSVYSGSGHITVKSSDSSEVKIVGRIHANDHNGWFGGSDGLSAVEKVKRLEANPPIQQNGNIIVAGKIDDRELRQNVSIDFDIYVPPETRVKAQTGSGDEQIVGVQGPLEASTGSGEIKASSIGSQVRLTTGSGDVQAENIKGDVHVQTGSGSIRVNGMNGRLDIHTGSGDLDVQGSPTDTVAETGSGHIRVRGVKGSVRAGAGSGDVELWGDPSSSWDAHTGSGEVTLHVSNAASFDIDADSSSGSVTVNHPLSVQGTIKRNRVEGKVGSGGAEVRLRTGSGDITVD